MKNNKNIEQILYKYQISNYKLLKFLREQGILNSDNKPTKRYADYWFDDDQLNFIGRSGIERLITYRY